MEKKQEVTFTHEEVKQMSQRARNDFERAVVPALYEVKRDDDGNIVLDDKGRSVLIATDKDTLQKGGEAFNRSIANLLFEMKNWFKQNAPTGESLSGELVFSLTLNKVTRAAKYKIGEGAPQGTYVLRADGGFKPADAA